MGFTLKAYFAWIPVLLLAGVTARATTLNFSTTIDQTNIGSLEPGDVVQGSLTFNPGSDAVPVMPGNVVVGYNYFGAITSFEIGGLELAGPQTANFIEIILFAPSGYGDEFIAGLETPAGEISFDVLAYGRTTGVLGNGSLATIASDFQPLISPSYRAGVNYSLNTDTYQYLVTNLTSAVLSADVGTVPEPASIAMLWCGLPIVFAAMSRQNRRQSVPQRRPFHQGW